MQNGVDYWPLSLFDPREGLQRDVAPVSNDPTLGGVMYYVQIDARNLSRYFAASGVYAAEGGATAKFDQGYSVYFSDRRNNFDPSASAALVGNETAEYGWEDQVNPASAAAGNPDNYLDLGEDVNASGTLDTYGRNPSFNGAAGAPPGAILPMTAAARPWTEFTTPAEAQGNRALLFRRALKLVNGGLGNLPPTGLTIVAENPIYVEGDWNANALFAAGSASAIIGDSVTLLSGNWDDDTSYTSPYNPGGRARTANSVLPLRDDFRQATVLPTADDLGGPERLRDRWRRAQLPAHAGNGRHGELPRIDRDVFLQPSGHGRVQVLQYGLRRARPQLHLRHELPQPGAPAAADPGVPRRKHARILPGGASSAVASYRLELGS